MCPWELYVVICGITAKNMTLIDKIIIFSLIGHPCANRIYVFLSPK